MDDTTCRGELSEAVSQLDRIEPGPSDAPDVERRTNFGGAELRGVVLRIERIRDVSVASVPLIPLVGEDIAFQSAKKFRKRRSLGITIRKTMVTLIATSCMEKELSLLYSDRDFDPFVRHLGLRSAN